MDTLDVREATMVIHDLGGPIALSAALERPARVTNIVVLNTFMWPVAERDDVQQIDGLLTSAVGEWLYIDRNLSPEMLLPGAFGDAFEPSDALLAQYTQPFADETTRRGLLEIGRSLAGDEALHADLWARRETLRPKIKALVFGLDDAFFGADTFQRWKAAFPEAQATGLSGVGHFPQEEAPQAVLGAVRRVTLRP